MGVGERQSPTTSQPHMGKRESQRPQGADAFDDFYADIYGSRWPSLRDALLTKPTPVRRWSQFSPASPPAHWNPIADWAPNCFPLDPPDCQEPRISQEPNYYVMDLASVIAAHSLPISSGDRVLDLCAAPGGKALILAEKLGPNGALVANDLSAARRARLTKTLRDYLPESNAPRVQVRGLDAGLWGQRDPGGFDAVLLDAPCSSERHVLGKPSELAKWRPNRVKSLAQRQYALLGSAILAAKPGAHILYATCSIAPQENDDVIARALDKRGDLIDPAPSHSPIGSPTPFGWILLPDQDPCGPLYFARLIRK